MGYDVHITRASEWAESDAVPITLEEWLTVIGNDREMRLDGYAEARMPDGTPRYENSGLAVWVAYSLNSEKIRHGLTIEEDESQ